MGELSKGPRAQAAERHVRLVFPHQLFLEHLRAEPGTRFVLVEDDLFYRQLAFHAHKLVLHRASIDRFVQRLESAGFETDVVRTSAQRSSAHGLIETLTRVRPTRVSVYDVVDDWLARDTSAALAAVGYRLTQADVLESPNFLTSRDQVRGFFDGRRARMAGFYSWQRRRLGILVEDGQPVGGRWSFDEDNRRRLPKGLVVPNPARPAHHPAVVAAIEWVQHEFPGAPGAQHVAHTFRWPTSHDEADAGLEDFLAHRFTDFGPYEDAISAVEPFLFHSLLTAGLNVGLLDPGHIVRRALAVADEAEGAGIPLASLEGFVRQVIGWREYMRATYHVHGRRLRSANALGHHRRLSAGWWTGETGLEPVDTVIQRVLQHGYAHHIERLMVLGNALALLRVDPDEVYEWFMAMFVDAYDWVMVPNVYAMSQFAAGPAITTKPYVSGSNYLVKMADFPRGDWQGDWDALYWAFVRDHRAVFETNPRARMMTRMWDGFEETKQIDIGRRAEGWLR